LANKGVIAVTVNYRKEGDSSIGTLNRPEATTNFCYHSVMIKMELDRHRKEVGPNCAGTTTSMKEAERLCAKWCENL
jgi:hypothetical protein